eukprot:403981-Pelagomonas_calceolata.AAC.2
MADVLYMKRITELLLYRAHTVLKAFKEKTSGNLKQPLSLKLQPEADRKKALSSSILHHLVCKRAQRPLAWSLQARI